MSVARFKVEFYDKTAEKEYLSLDGSVRAMVDKGIARLALRADEIGKPLSGLLAGCRELKFRTDGIRVIYRIRDGHVEVVQIIAIGTRDKDRVLIWQPDAWIAMVDCLKMNLICSHGRNARIERLDLASGRAANENVECDEMP